MGKNEGVNVVDVEMSSGGPRGAPNMSGEWLPHQVEAQGGVLRDYGGGSGEKAGVLDIQSGGASAAGGVRPKVAKGGRGRGGLAVVKGKEARKGIEALMKRYGVK